MFHREGQMVHGGAKWSMDNVKCCTVVLNIRPTMPNVPRRC